MNDPIDILEVAATRYAKALEWWQATQEMNFSIEAVVVGERAQASLAVARDDLWRARKLSHDVDLVLS